MLPASYRWTDGADASHLHYNFGCVASVTADGRVTILAGKRIEGKAASVAQGKRYVERWIEVNGHPPSKRVLEIRERLGIKPRR